MLVLPLLLASVGYAQDNVELDAPEFMNCGACNGQQCVQAGQCPSSSPYMCTSGPAYKGCSRSPWANSSACQSCCYAPSCSPTPTPPGPTPTPRPGPAPGPTPNPGPSPGGYVCGQASADEERTKWPFTVNQNSWYSCASSAGRTNDLGNSPHMCQGAPNSVRIAVRRGQAECLVTQSPCKIQMRDFVSLDYDFVIMGCDAMWSAPLWMTPDKWQWGPGSGEIDSTEMCPRNAMYLNFAGGGHQVRTGFALSAAYGHITVRKDYAGIVTIVACQSSEARANRGQCYAPRYSSCGQCMSAGNSYGCWCNAANNNIYGSGGCQNGGDCMWTLVSDIWNGVRGDDGYNACMTGIPGVVGHGQPNLNSNCQFQVTNIMLRGGGPNGSMRWGPGSPASCAYLTPRPYATNSTKHATA